MLALVAAGLAIAGPARSSQAGQVASRAGQAARQPGLALVQVEANEGASSGGHAALQLGDWIYHYQVIGGEPRLRLERERWEPFLARETGIGNRAVHRFALALEPPERERVRRRLERLRFVQEEQERRLALARLERRWVASAGGEVGAWLPLPGGSLFARGGWSGRDARAVAGRVTARAGAGRLRDALAAVQAELLALRPGEDLPDTESWRREGAPGAPSGRGQRLQEALWMREALLALLEARPLAEGTRVAVEAGRGDLTDRERRTLARLRERLEASAIALLDSARPDAGRALLLALARAQIVEGSLRRGRLQVLDPFGRDPAAPRARGPGPDLREVRVAAETWGALAVEHRRALFGAPDPEAALARLETSATLASRTRRAAEGGDDGRLRGLGRRRGSLPPGFVRAPRLALGPGGIERLEEASRERERRIEDALQRLWGYELLTRNCATELVAAWTRALGGRERTAALLGGRLDPGSGGGFVPALWMAQARTRLRGAPWPTPAPHRAGRVAEMAESEPGWRVWLREGNTLSSSLYRRPRRDGHFLFFTDRHPLWRPLLGAANLVYGAAQGALGALTWPADGGERLERGVRGVFYSVPELVFLSLRKGHFETARLESSGPASPGLQTGAEPTPSVGGAP